MIIITVDYHVKSGKMDEVLENLRDMAAVMKIDEPDCLGYMVLRQSDADDRLLLVETYRDQAALDAHRETPHFKAILEGKVIPLLESRTRRLYAPEIV